jgi:CO/xanthine dehydrogenase FAD-binding subunit
MGPVAMRLSQTEAVLSGQSSAAASWAAAAVTCGNDVSPQNDLRGSAAYRFLVLQTLMAQLHRAPEASA